MRAVRCVDGRAAVVDVAAPTGDQPYDIVVDAAGTAPALAEAAAADRAAGAIKVVLEP